MRDWRQGEAGELRGPKVELARGSRGSEKVWSGGFTAASSSPEFGRWQWCSGVSGRGFDEEARETESGGSAGAAARERRGAGVLPWAGHGGGEVAAVWGLGVRGRDGEAPARGEKGGEELGRDAWVPRRAGGGLRPSTATGGAAQCQWQSK